MTDLIVFEQPINEAIRICLRLEQLEKQFSYFMKREDPTEAKVSMGILLETLRLAIRPDLKSKLTQMLAQFNATLSQLQRLPDAIDLHLQDIRKKIDYLTQSLHGTHGRIGETLRNNEFLNGLLLQISTPGGICESSSALYALWLRLPWEKQRQQLQSWYDSFQLLNQTMQLILHLTRESSLPVDVLAKDGFYQQSLPINPPCQLIRIAVSAARCVYPEISVGKYRLSVHFLSPSYSDGMRPKQCREDIEMSLTCCQL